MDFSELCKQTGQNCKFSPNNKYLANTSQYKLIVREVKSLQVTYLFTCQDVIQCIEWSSDSCYILCGLYKRGIVQVWSINNTDWTCKIDEGSAGLVNAFWSPDGRHIITTAHFHVRMTIWSLVTKSVLYMKHPKACQKGHDFSGNGKYLALAERRTLNDYISIFETNGWELLNHFKCETEDLATIQWSPDSQLLAVSESCLKYNILLYSLDGRCLASYSAYDQCGGLAIKSLAWSPTSQFIALGSYDDKLRLLNHLTWTLISEVAHPTKLNASNVVIYKEEVRKPQLLLGESSPPAGMAFSSNSKYEILKGIVTLPSLAQEPDRANPRKGVGRVQFSYNAQFFYTLCDNMPKVLWIWDIKKLALAAVIIQEDDINDICWAPDQGRLALCCGNNKLYMWSPAGALSVEVPVEHSFQTCTLQWHLSGESLLLVSKTEMCICFLASTNQTNEQSKAVEE